MSEFWVELEKLIKSHEQSIKNKNKYIDLYNKSVKEKNYNQCVHLDLNIKKHTKEQQKIFFNICSIIYKYMNENNYNYKYMEQQFRKRNLNIYVIARKFANNNKSISCKLHNNDMEYEGNIVVTDDIEYYNNELKKFGYCDKVSNYNNLDKCGFLTVNSDNASDIKNYCPDDTYIEAKDLI